MPEGGSLTLTVSRRQAPDGAVGGAITVADTGTGIAPDARPHIFDPFFTTKEVGSGSGLGLAMVYGFVQQSGGTLTFESTVGAGTAFELTPVAPGPGSAGRQRVLEKIAIACGSPTPTSPCARTSGAGRSAY
jgi:K+-sensing histidine kinase KdpD